MVLLGLLFLLVGYIVGVGPLVTIGWVILLAGLVLMLLAMAGRPVGNRNWY